MPWQGESGTSETVGQLMQRERARELIGGPRTHRVIPFRTDPHRKYNPQNPKSPESPGWPVFSSPLKVQSSLSTPGPFTPQAVGPPNFLGATLADTHAFPPDSMGAVGPTQYIVAVNGRIRSFNKATGVADNVLNLDTDTFFASVMTPSGSACLTNPYDCTFTSDPRIRYDRLSGRWFIVMIDVPSGSTNNQNRVLIAVSSGSIITGISNFTFFEFQHDLVGTTPNVDTSLFADYPTLGIDANALYIGVNVFSSTAFSNTTGFVVLKSSITGSGSIVVTPFRGLITTTDGPFTPQGVDNYDPAANEGYFIGVSANYFGKLILLKVSNPGTTPSISGNISIDVPSTYAPITVPHLGNTLGTNGELDALDDRLFAAHLRNGHLWTAHNISVDNSGVGTPSGNRDGSRWYEIINLPTTPVLRQSGTVFDSGASNPLFYWIPSIMVSGQGHAALGFSTAGAADYINAATVGRLTNDTLGTTETPAAYTNSITAYNPLSDPGGTFGRRWGDYSYTSLDPVDDMTLWTIQEFCNATNSYGVQVVKLLAPPPATPVSVSPPTVYACQSSLGVTVTGTSVSGSGFFDPGPGFNRIGASVGGGVTVNSVTYTGPTQINLNINTGAAVGAKTVTVTNPDGQSKASGSPILNVVTPITISPSSIPSGTMGTAYSQTFTPGGGTGPYTISLTGSLPAGISFSSNTSTGAISGTTTVTGGFPFTVSAVDNSTGCLGSGSYTLRVSEPSGVITDVRINGTTPAYYDTVQGALNAAVNNDSIQMRAVNFTETLFFIVPAAIKLSGGYNNGYSSNLLSYTTVTGSLTISAGTVTIENVTIK